MIVKQCEYLSLFIFMRARAPFVICRFSFDSMLKDVLHRFSGISPKVILPACQCLCTRRSMTLTSSSGKSDKKNPCNEVYTMQLCPIGNSQSSLNKPLQKSVDQVPCNIHAWTDKLCYLKAPHLANPSLTIY